MRRFFRWLRRNDIDKEILAAKKAKQLMEESRKRTLEDKQKAHFFRTQREENHLAERFQSAFRGDEPC